MQSAKKNEVGESKLKSHKNTRQRFFMFFFGRDPLRGSGCSGFRFHFIACGNAPRPPHPSRSRFEKLANFAKRKPRTKLLRNYSACRRLSQSETRNKFIAMRHLAQAASQGSPIFRPCNYSSLIMLMPLEVPSLVAPAAINSLANRAVRMPPLAFTPKSSPTVFRIRAT